jgi:type II secretory pathway pseudopilin PulG
VDPTQPAPPPPPGPPGYPPPPGAPGYPPPGYYPAPHAPKQASLLWLWILLGVLGFVMVLGIVAAVAIPSFMDYAKKAKRSEAQLNLNRARHAAMAYYAENAQFPTQSSGPTPALGECCRSPGHKCSPDYTLWQTEPWRSLDFTIDEPSMFSYSYEGSPDGQSFTLTAHGDLDCDNNYADYVLKVSAPGGNPTYELIEPARPD